MAEEGVYMDIPAVQTMAQGFHNFSDLLRGISKVMEAAMTTLKATAFVGLVGGAAVERYLSIIKPRVDKLSTKCEEINRDLNDAIKAYRDGDRTGSQRYMG